MDGAAAVQFRTIEGIYSERRKFKERRTTTISSGGSRISSEAFDIDPSMKRPSGPWPCCFILSRAVTFSSLLVSSPLLFLFLPCCTFSSLLFSSPLLFLFLPCCSLLSLCSVVFSPDILLQFSSLPAVQFSPPFFLYLPLLFSESLLTPAVPFSHLQFFSLSFRPLLHFLPLRCPSPPSCSFISPSVLFSRLLSHCSSILYPAVPSLHCCSFFTLCCALL